MKKAGLIALLCAVLGFLTVRSCELSSNNLESIIKAKIKESKSKEKITHNKVKEIIRQRSVMISDSTGIGTGIIISPTGYIITAKHVTGNQCDPILKIIFYDQTSIGPEMIEVIFTHEKADFTLLKIKKPTINFAPLAATAEIRSLDGGDKLWLCGNSYTLSFLLVNEISFLVGDREPTSTPLTERLFYFDNFNGPGGSGGGVFTKTGGLAGMYLGALSIAGFPPAGKALHVDTIRHFLEQNNVDYKNQINFNDP